MRSTPPTTSPIRLTQGALALSLWLACTLGGPMRSLAADPGPPPLESEAASSPGPGAAVAEATSTGPPDPYDRGTPRGALEGFLQATRKGQFERAAHYLDLRPLPEELRESGPQLARQLKAVLDRTLSVDFAALSPTPEGRSDDDLPAWRDLIGVVQTQQGPTALLMHRVAREEDGVWIWKVAASSLSQVPELYAEFGPVWLERWLPAFFFEFHLLDAAIWQWVALLGLALGAGVVALVIGGPSVRATVAVLGRGSQAIDPRIVTLVRGPVRLAIGVLLFALGRQALGLGLAEGQSLRILERLLLVVAVAWAGFRFIDLAVLALRIRAEQRDNTSLLPIFVPMQRFAKILVLVIGLLGVLGSLGVNISAAVAGIGVGGIALALAAQKTIENLFGGVTLFADRPVQVGDFFRWGTQVGTVEEIGLRSTRVRTLDRTLISIPNGEFSNLALENFAKRDRMRLWTMIGVRYETTPGQLRYLLARLRELLLAHPRVTDEPARVRLVGFGAYSIDLEVFAYVDTADWNEFLQVREDLYLRFMDAIDEAGTGFAFPSSTTYLGRDDGLSPDKIEHAETRVQEWASKGELPFPHFPPEFAQRVKNTLEWPPAGSPDARPRETSPSP